jgi:GntR family transcriptional regulator
MKLAINPNTISRAYKELEQEGFIYTVAGRGTFINQEFDLNDSRKEELWQQFDKAVKGLLEISVSVSEMTERMDKLGDNENRTSSDSEKGGSTDDSGK